MIANRTQTARPLVLDGERGEISPRLLELRIKIHDKEYVNNAIQRIAQVISRKLVEEPEELQFWD